MCYTNALNSYIFKVDLVRGSDLEERREPIIVIPSRMYSIHLFIDLIAHTLLLLMALTLIVYQASYLYVCLFQESLLNYRNRWFTDEAPQKVMDKFRSNLRQISDNMKRRNKLLETPYDYLLPEKIYMRFDV